MIRIAAVAGQFKLIQPAHSPAAMARARGGAVVPNKVPLEKKTSTLKQLTRLLGLL